MDEYNEVSDTCVNKAHVFILGAGASIAAFPKGDKEQRHLPSMQNFISTLERAVSVNLRNYIHPTQL